MRWLIWDESRATRFLKSLAWCHCEIRGIFIYQYEWWTFWEISCGVDKKKRKYRAWKYFALRKWAADRTENRVIAQLKKGRSSSNARAFHSSGSWFDYAQAFEQRFVFHSFVCVSSVFPHSTVLFLFINEQQAPGAAQHDERQAPWAAQHVDPTMSNKPPGLLNMSTQQRATSPPGCSAWRATSPLGCSTCRWVLLIVFSD